jgi:hypothetical protein
MLVKELSGGALESSIIEPLKELMIKINENFNIQGYIISNIEEVINDEKTKIDTRNYTDPNDNIYSNNKDNIQTKLKNNIESISKVKQIIDKNISDNEYILYTISQNNYMLNNLVKIVEYNYNNVNIYKTLLNQIKNILVNDPIYSELFIQKYYKIIIKIDDNMFKKLKNIGLYKELNSKIYGYSNIDINIIALYIIVYNFFYNIIKTDTNIKNNNTIFKLLLNSLNKLIIEIMRNTTIKGNYKFNLELKNLINDIQLKQVNILSNTIDYITIAEYKNNKYSFNNINKYLEQFDFKINIKLNNTINDIISINYNYDNIFDIPTENVKSINDYIYNIIIGDHNVILLADLSKEIKTGYDNFINNELATNIITFFEYNYYTSNNAIIINIYNKIKKIMEYTLRSNMKNINTKQTLLSSIQYFDFDITNYNEYMIYLQYITNIVVTYCNYNFSAYKQKLLNKIIKINNHQDDQYIDGQIKKINISNIKILDDMTDLKSKMYNPEITPEITPEIKQEIKQEINNKFVNKINSDTENSITPDTKNSITPDTENSITPDTENSINSVTENSINSVTENLINKDQVGGGNETFITFIQNLYKTILNKKVTVLINLINVIYNQYVNDPFLYKLSMNEYLNYHIVLNNNTNLKNISDTFLHLYYYNILCDILLLIPEVSNEVIQHKNGTASHELNALEKAAKEAVEKAEKTASTKASLKKVAISKQKVEKAAKAEDKAPAQDNTWRFWNKPKPKPKPKSKS